MLVVIPITADVAANTSIALPVAARRICTAHRTRMSDGTAAGASSALTIVTTTPGTGEIQLYDYNNVRCGDALSARDLLVLRINASGEVQGYGDGTI